MNHNWVTKVENLSCTPYSIPLTLPSWIMYLRASPMVLSMWLCKNISHIPSFSYFTLFFNPTHQTEKGHYSWETSNSNPPRQIEWSTQSELVSN
jgi:hypothetical protein